jgi:hypothetical protein
MKNKIYLLGIILIILFTLGAIFKMMHWPGAGIVLTVSLGLFSLVFAPLAVINCYREEKKYAFVYLAGLITISFNFLGALFKLQHWPGAGILLTIAIIIPFVYFLPAFLIYMNKSAEKTMKKLISVLFILVFVAAMDALLALNVSKTILNDSALINDHYTLLATYYEKSSDDKKSSAGTAYLDQLNILSDKSDLLVSEINDLKILLITTVTEDNKESIDDTEKIDIWKVRGKDNRNVPSTIMINEEKALTLKNSVNEYKTFALGFSEASDSEFINKYLSTGDILWDDETYTWEVAHFHGSMLVWAINYLTSLEFKIRMVEAELAENLMQS